MSSLRIRLIQKTDFVFADSLRALAGWNQTKDDWMRFLNHQPDGCFIAEWDGQPVGTATTTIYEDKVAWIGMVLVHPDARRRGIGRALLEHCIAFLKPRVACIKLDATPLGKTLYDTLGFKDEWTLQRWQTDAVTMPAEQQLFRVQRWCDFENDLPSSLDLAAFGVNRWPMIQRLVRQVPFSFTHQTVKRRVIAFGVTRKGCHAHYLGPIVGESFAAVGPLIKTLAYMMPNVRIFWDIPDANTCAVELAQRLGFQPQRPLIRMFLGENKWPGDPQRIFGLAGPEIG